MSLGAGGKKNRNIIPPLGSRGGMLARCRPRPVSSELERKPQAQLNLTQAQIENLSAKYDYETQYSALQYTIGALR